MEADAIAAGEVHTSVPWRYRARLERTVRVAKKDAEKKVGHDKVGLAEESAIVTGQVHPEPFTYLGAVDAAESHLASMINEGWRVVDLRVLAYGEKP